MKAKTLVPWLVVPLVLATLFVLVVSGVLPYKLYVVHTGSMSPTIPSRSAVIVREHQYRVGEPISFVVNGAVITHRLVAIGTDGMITTKGDANATPDPWHVPTSSIIGGVIASPPEVGYWLTYLKNPLGLASILASIVLLWEVWSLAGAATREPQSGASKAGSGGLTPAVGLTSGATLPDSRDGADSIGEEPPPRPERGGEGQRAVFVDEIQRRQAS